MPNPMKTLSPVAQPETCGKEMSCHPRTSCHPLPWHDVSPPFPRRFTPSTTFHPFHTLSTMFPHPLPFPVAQPPPTFRNARRFPTLSMMFPLFDDVSPFRQCFAFSTTFHLFDDVSPFRRCSPFSTMFPLSDDVPPFQ